MADISLADIKVEDLPKYHSVALSRLTLYTIGETHRILSGFQDYLLELATSNEDSEGFADVSGILQSWGIVSEQYKKAFDAWTQLFTAARIQAGSLPFAVLAAQHNHFMGGAELAEAETLVSITGFESGTLGSEDIELVQRMFVKRRDEALKAAQQNVSSDGFTLSHRIWRIQNDGLSGIKAVIADVYANRTSTLKLAKSLEDKLGADADMPRWVASRLYGMTATERMQSDKGLLSGQATSRGIAYNAIRLARTELQIANHAVSTSIVANLPWVTGRNVVLSPAHPVSDICDKWASGGPYPKTQSILPLHPNCLCYYIDVLSSMADFKSSVQGWMTGENNDLDAYADWLGTRQVNEKLPLRKLSLVDSLEIWINISKGAQAAVIKLKEIEPPKLSDLRKLAGVEKKGRGKKEGPKAEAKGAEKGKEEKPEAKPESEPAPKTVSVLKPPLPAVIQVLQVASEFPWKPVMTVDEADQWARNSALKGVYVHVTADNSANAIKEEGFQVFPGPSNYYGAGVYLTKDIPGSFAGTASLETRVNVKNPYYYFVDQQATVQPALTSKEQSPISSEVNQYMKDHPGAQKSEAVTEVLLAKGYDSVVTQEDEQIVVVFDPHNVVVVERQKIALQRGR